MESELDQMRYERDAARAELAELYRRSENVIAAIIGQRDAMLAANKEEIASLREEIRLLRSPVVEE